MIKLQPGDYVSTEGMTEEQYHAVCKAFMDAGAESGEYGKPISDWGYIGWAIPAYTNSNITQSGIFRFSKASHDGYFKRIRLLTINQILCSDNTEGTKEMNLQEAYKVMQANCGIEVGDTVKVLRKAKSYEMGWEDSWALAMDETVGELYTVISYDEEYKEFRLDNHFQYPFFVLELVKKGKKLQEPIRISTQYQCEFKEDGSITVGCQSLDFEFIEKIYMTAKEVKENK